MIQSTPFPATFESTLARIRLEVCQRKGISPESVPPVEGDLADGEAPPPPKEKKTPLEKASRGMERARSKHEKAQRWPRMLRGLRRDQDVINQELIESVTVLTGEVEQLQKMVFSLINQQVQTLMQQQASARQIDTIEQQYAALEEALATVAGASSATAAAQPADTDAFYVALEERFRGSRECIKERLPEYLPFLRQLRERLPGAEALDLGCGRGEWLELLRDEGIAGRGVDTSGRMVEQCRALGLDAVKGDALAWLRGVPDAALGLVTAFHLVEHLPFPVLHGLFQECARVLRPGGMAIFETPNPECPRVSGYAFYLDPTHRNPVPHELLAFLGTHAGFSTVHIERLHPNVEVGVFKGYGDYAAIFTK